MSTSLSTPAPTATPASAPSSGTYNIYARGLGVFLEFADGNEGTNLTTWKAAGGNASQQASPLSFTILVLMLTQLILVVASHRKPFNVLHISERFLWNLFLLFELCEIFYRRPDTVQLVYRSIPRRIYVSAQSNQVLLLYLMRYIDSRLTLRLTLFGMSRMALLSIIIL